MPKILISDALGANHFIRSALVSAIRQLPDWQVVFWNDQEVSAFDVFQTFSPDIILSSTWQLNRPLMKNLLSRPHTKLALFADMYGPLQEEMDLVKYPVSVITPEQLGMLHQLVGGMSNFSTVITQHSESSKEKTHGWYTRDFNLSILSLMTCADISSYYPQQPDLNIYDDYVYTGGMWPFKSKYLNQYILPLTYPNLKLKGKIFGSGWSVPNAVGRADDNTIRKYYASTSFIPSIYEPHAIEVYGDLPQRCFQTAACGGFQLSQKAISLDEVLNETEVKTFNNEDEYLYNIGLYTEDKSLSIPYRVAGCKRVFSEHTNFHRISKLFKELGEDTTQINTMIGKNYDWAMNELGKIYGNNV